MDKDKLNDEKDIKKPASGLAGSSMAYMPGTTEKEDADEISMGKVGRDEEKKTMADIASDLESDDKKTAVKVGVTTKAKAKTVAKDEDVLPALDKEPELSDAELDSLQSVPPVAKVPRGGKGGKGFLIFLVIVLLGATATFGWLWYSARTDNTALQSKVNSLEGKSGSPTTTPAVTASDTRLITELGLDYKLNDSTENLTYRYRETIDAEKQSHQVITFSSVDVVTAEREVSTAAPKCTAEFAPLGALTAYKEGDVYKGAKVETLKADQQTIFHIGDTYYIYEAAQATCSANKTVQDKVVTDKTKLNELLTSLKEAQ